MPEWALRGCKFAAAARLFGKAPSGVMRQGGLSLVIVAFGQDVKGFIGSKLMMDPYELSFLVKQGCAWRVQSDHEEIARKAPRFVGEGGGPCWLRGVVCPERMSCASFRPTSLAAGMDFDETWPRSTSCMRSVRRCRQHRPLLLSSFDDISQWTAWRRSASMPRLRIERTRRVRRSASHERPPHRMRVARRAAGGS